MTVIEDRIVTELAKGNQTIAALADLVHEDEADVSEALNALRARGVTRFVGAAQSGQGETSYLWGLAREETD